MDRCAQCHQPLPQSAERFCVYCGAPIPAPPSRTSVPVLVAVCVVALALVAGVAVVFFVVRPGKPQPAAAPAVPATTSQTPTAGPRRTPSPSSSSPSSPTSASTPTSTSSVVPADPADVVTAFYDAINARDFPSAWNLGGKNFGRSYAEFAGGFSNTLYDDITITSVTGNTVKVTVFASESGGVTSTYQGSYTVQGGEITTGTLKKTG
ncbi:MAG TPA: zinc ribbon domain-containing protein [Amycolatopsis sp.]|nr:zinc ribbon domain-containing protein [Amycolatopsis sp.]